VIIVSDGKIVRFDVEVGFMFLRASLICWYHFNVCCTF